MSLRDAAERTAERARRAVARIRRLIQMRIRRLAARARADRNLAHRHETVVAILVITLFWAAMFGAAMIGADRQDAALAAERQELEAERVRVAHELRAEHPPGIWRRWCVDGENWSTVRQRCE